jgi:4-amino-4-deoxy-L-arabinose transferase-like glycosyltransferase
MGMKRDSYLKVVISLVFVNFLLRLPFLNIPAHWDEVNYLDGVRIIFMNNLNPFVEYWGYKPPFLFEAVAILYELFFPSRIWGRIIVYFLSSLAILFNYLLAKKLFNREVGLYSSLMLFSFPLFATQSFLFQDAIPLTSLILTTLFFYFTKRKLAYFISAIFFILIKETAIFTLVFLMIFDFYVNFRKSKIDLLLKRAVFLISPALFLFIWMLLNKRVFGWFLWPLNVSPFSVENLKNFLNFQKLTRVFYGALQVQFLWFVFSIIFGGVIFSIGKGKSRRERLKPKVIFFLLVFFFYFLFHIWGVFLPRYLLFVYPLVFISCCHLIDRQISKKKIKLIITLIICLGFSYANIFYAVEASPLFYDMDRDFSFFGSIAIRKKALRYLEENYQGAVVIAGWPTNRLWEDPYFGYVSEGHVSFGLAFLEDKRELDDFLRGEGSRPVLFISNDDDYISAEAEGYLGDLSLEQGSALIREVKPDIPLKKQDRIRIFKLK